MVINMKLKFIMKRGVSLLNYATIKHENSGLVQINLATCRNNDIDIIKGCLVVIMILYHCASVSSFSSLQVIKHYFHFIHTAFLLLTGIICGFYYFEPTKIITGKIHRGLLLRSAKLLTIFLLANVVFYSFGIGPSYSKLLEIVSDPRIFFQEFVIGVGDDIVAYEILYLISGVLFLSSFFSLFIHFKKISILLVIVFVCMPGMTPMYMAYGFAGILLGITIREKQKTKRLFVWDRLLPLFPFILLLIIYYGVPVKWSNIRYIDFIARVIETLIWFFSFLWIIKKINIHCVERNIVLLGRYTLFAYLFQMVCARVVYHLMMIVGVSDIFYYIFSLTLVGGLTLIAVIGLNFIINSFSTCNRLYKIIF